MPTRGAVQPCLRLDALLSSAESATAADPPTPARGPGTYLAQDYRPYLRVALSQDWPMCPIMRQLRRGFLAPEHLRGPEAS